MNLFFFNSLLWLALSFSTPFLNESSAAEVRVVSFKELQPMLEKQNDTIYVVNFWATWCAPCVEEIPYFEQLGEKYRDKGLKVLMVSLDFPNQLQTRLIPFMEKYQMNNEVVLLDDPRANSWIPKVDEKWTGALPATLVYGDGFRRFFPHGLTFSELEEIVVPLLK